MSKRFYLKHRSMKLPSVTLRKAYCYCTQYLYPIQTTSSTCDNYLCFILISSHVYPQSASRIPQFTIPEAPIVQLTSDKLHPSLPEWCNGLACMNAETG